VYVDEPGPDSQPVLVSLRTLASRALRPFMVRVAPVEPGKPVWPAGPGGMA